MALAKGMDEGGERHFDPWISPAIVLIFGGWHGNGTHERFVPHTG